MYQEEFTFLAFSISQGIAGRTSDMFIFLHLQWKVAYSARLETREKAMRDAHEHADSSENQMILHLLSSIAKCTRSLILLKVSEIDLHIGQYEIIAALHDDQPISISLLADIVNVRPSTASKSIDHLAYKELIEKFEDPSDSRRILIRLTPIGMSIKATAIQILQSLDDELFGKLHLDEMEVIFRSLIKTERILKTKLRRLR